MVLTSSRFGRKLQEEDMVLEDTKENRVLQQACASLAIEDMFPNEDFVQELERVAKGEKSSETLRQEVIEKYV